MFVMMRGAASVSVRLDAAANLFRGICDGRHGHRPQRLPLRHGKQSSRIWRGVKGNLLVHGKGSRERPAGRLEVAKIGRGCGQGHDLGPRGARDAVVLERGIFCDGTLAGAVDIFAALN